MDPHEGLLETLWQAAAKDLKAIDLQKVGIWMSELTESALLSPTLFDSLTSPKQERRQLVSRVMDRINQKFGKDAVLLGMPATLTAYSGTKIAFNRIPDREEFFE